MESLHFGIRSGKHGDATQHLSYINREGYYRSRNDLAASGHGNMPSFAQSNPMLLWKASDKFERRNGSTFRSYVISLPNVLEIDSLVRLAEQEAIRLAGPKPYQWALHISRSSLTDQLNPHVHIVICDRLPDGIDRPPEQMFKRYNPKDPKIGGCRKDSGGRSNKELRSQLTSQREAAAEVINIELSKQGYNFRIDPRTLKERGVKRAPERYLGPAKIRKMTPEERAEYRRRLQVTPKELEAPG